MFVGRTEELSKLSDAMKQAGRASLVYGKRRVGKTRLIKEALNGQVQPVIYYECIRGTMQENINAFTRLLTELRILTFTSSFQSFSDVFAYLNTLPRSFVVVIDEYPYLSSLADAEIVDSVFQTVIDQKLSNIHLVLSGSQASVMKNLLRKGNALYGRFQLILHLRELDYKDASLFYPSLSPYEKIAFYSVFGGSPFILQELREKESLEQNIVRTPLSTFSLCNIHRTASPRSSSHSPLCCPAPGSARFRGSGSLPPSEAGCVSAYGSPCCPGDPGYIVPPAAGKGFHRWTWTLSWLQMKNMFIRKNR